MFDYLGVLISVILGLALTHILLGLSRMIQEREHVKAWWVHLAWCANILIYVLGIWWGMYWWRHLQAWTIQNFLFLAAYSGVLFLLAAMLFPHEGCKGIDFHDYFMKNRRWFFGLQLLAYLLDIPETLAKGVDGLRSVPVEYCVFLPLMLAVNVVGLLSANRRVHGALCVVSLATMIGYLTFTSLDRIVAH